MGKKKDKKKKQQKDTSETKALNLDKAITARLVEIQKKSKKGAEKKKKEKKPDYSSGVNVAQIAKEVSKELTRKQREHQDHIVEIYGEYPFGAYITANVG